MSETNINYHTYIDTIDVNGDKKTDGYSQNVVKEKAKSYIQTQLQNGISPQELNQLLQKVKQLLERQNGEKTNLIEELKSQTLQESKQEVEKEALIAEVKTMMYEKLAIHENVKDNTPFENFLKGVVDELIIGNYELAIDVWNTNGQILLDSLKALASWEGIKKIATGLGESIWNLFDGNAYQRGKSAAQLGLISTGVAAGVMVGKKAVRLGVKEFAKLRVNKELLVSAPDVKHTLKQTAAKVNEIVPKKQLDFQNMVVGDVAKLSHTQRLEAAGAFLNKSELSVKQKDAIIKAHQVGEQRAGAGVYRYNFSEKSQKLKILSDAGFSKEERKILLQKGVCGKEVAVDFNKVDLLEMKGNYKLSQIDDLKTIEAKHKIEEFSDAIDTQYLVNHPQRIDDMLEIVEYMTEYVSGRHHQILALGKKELQDFRYVFGEFMKNIDNLSKENIMMQFKTDLIDIRQKMRDTMIQIHPSLAPKE